VGRRGLDSSDSVVSSCEYGNEPSSSVKGGKLLGKLRDYQLLQGGFRSTKLVS
jgi:hypothetical protein